MQTRGPVTFYCRPDDGRVLFTKHILRPREPGPVPRRPRAYREPKELHSFYRKGGEAGRLGLNRGHLVPLADFVEKSDRKVTCDCENIVPQTRSVNNGNVKTVEEAARRRVNLVKSDMTVFSGHLGVMPHAVTVPVPRFLYKVFIGCDTAIVVVISNDPAGDPTGIFSPIAPNRELPPWLGVDNSDPARGLTCTMLPDEFAEWCERKFPGTPTPFS